jgi:hypothetical protein
VITRLADLRHVKVNAGFLETALTLTWRRSASRVITAGAGLALKVRSKRSSASKTRTDKPDVGFVHSLRSLVATDREGKPSCLALILNHGRGRVGVEGALEALLGLELVRYVLEDQGEAARDAYRERFALRYRNNRAPENYPIERVVAGERFHDALAEAGDDLPEFMPVDACGHGRCGPFVLADRRERD